MLIPTLPTSLAELLSVFGPCFTAPTFRTFTALAAGFLAQQGQGTVTGMLVGAGLAGVWHHTRAHRFFSAARWSVDRVGLALLDVIVRLLIPSDAPMLLAVDDSLFKRRGRKIFGAAWHHDAAAPGRNRVAWGNSWVVVGVLVRLPFVAHRMVCLPVLARLWQPAATTKGARPSVPGTPWPPPTGRPSSPSPASWSSRSAPATPTGWSIWSVMPPTSAAPGAIHPPT